MDLNVLSVSCTSLLTGTLDERQGEGSWTVLLVPTTSTKSENIPDGLLCALWSPESSSHQTCPANIRPVHVQLKGMLLKL